MSMNGATNATAPLLARQRDREVAAPLLRQKVPVKGLSRGAEDALSRPHHVPDSTDRKAPHLERVKEAELQLEAHTHKWKNGHPETMATARLRRRCWPAASRDVVRAYARGEWPPPIRACPSRPRAATAGPANRSAGSTGCRFTGGWSGVQKHASSLSRKRSALEQIVIPELPAGNAEVGVADNNSSRTRLRLTTSRLQLDPRVELAEGSHRIGQHVDADGRVGRDAHQAASQPGDLIEPRHSSPGPGRGSGPPARAGRSRPR